MSYTPSVSVIMTVYNGEKYLREAINSIIEQTLTDIELIIVDDGSTDSTPHILKEFCSDSRINVIIRRRAGRIPSLNYAWRLARGNYIANLDSDDLSEPTRLEKQFYYLEKHPEVGLLGTACRVFSEENRDETLLHFPESDVQLRKKLVCSNPFVHSSVMIPRKVLEALNGYDEKLKLTEDYELWVRIARHYKLACLPDILASRRLHNNHAFYNQFRSRNKARERYMTLTNIRWKAWRNLSRRFMDLRFVIGPLIKQLSA
ncbi:MAG: glycosyltransferase family 2 protein [Thermosynechococcaceae cyanobacterium]